MTVQLNLWLHLMAFATYTGLTLAVLILSLSLTPEAEEPESRQRILGGAMRVYNPLALAALGVLLVTGALNLSAYGAAVGQPTYQRIDGPLGWKLLLTVLLFNLTAYITFGIGNRVVRYCDAGQTLAPEMFGRLIVRLRATLALALVLVAAVLRAALLLGHGAA